MAPSETSSSPERPKNSEVHPLLRNALRLTISADEYEAFYRLLEKRTSEKIHSRALHPTRYRQLASSTNKFRDAALRDSLRTFIAAATAAQLADLLLQRLKKGAAERIPSLRIASSVSLTLLLHRLIRRFLVRLRANLRNDDARPFRDRNPRVAGLLTHRYTPPIGASAAGFALALFPEGHLRSYLALYLFVRALEATYNVVEKKEYFFKEKPWWFGSWLLMPLSVAQLFHAFVFDRETIPGWLSTFLLGNAPAYIQTPSEGLPAAKKFPTPSETVDALARLAELKWPAFTSPILHPAHPQPLPPGVEKIAYITNPAHPSISSLSCAMLHPKLTSCLNVAVQQSLLTIPKLGRRIVQLLLLAKLIYIKDVLRHPLKAANSICTNALTGTFVLTAALSSAWSSICLLNSYLPRRLLPTQRLYISGMLAGLPFGAMHGQGNRDFFMYFFRMAISSLWETGKKKKIFRPIKNGDLFVISASWAALAILLNGRPKTVPGKSFRKGLTWCQGNGFVDPVVVSKEKAEKTKGKKAQE
ncbi:hypothetical protein KEM55_002176 [Ascosphaera atra]|nr:hypothetical protein KEM55_002176 [Ascosphaera atra]